MTKRDFFMVIIRLFGLYILILFLFNIISNVLQMTFSWDIYSLLWIFLSVILIVGAFVLLILKTPKIVQWLKLTKDFDEDRMNLGSLSESGIIKLGTFIIGGFLIIDNIPFFLNEVIFHFKNSFGGIPFGLLDPKEKYEWIISGSKIILGIIFVANFTYVANLFQKWSKAKNKQVEGS